jgi:hypothetical protein
MMRALKWLLEIAFFCGLVTAYTAAGAGLIGWLGAHEVALYALYGGAFAFIAAAIYFIVASLEIRHRFNSAQ